MKKTVIFLLCTLLSIPLFASAVQKGDTREQVIQKLGEPTGGLSMGSRETLTYNGATIKLKDGKVYHIDRDFKSKQVAGKARADFNQAQQAKGLVLYQGKWVNKEKLAELKKQQQAADSQRQAKQAPNVINIREKGKTIDMGSILVPGKITLVDFYADWCGPCKRLDPALIGFARADDDVVLRKIDIVKWGTPVTQQYNISSIPHVRVYDRQGKMVGSPTSNQKKIGQYIRQAKR